MKNLLTLGLTLLMMLGISMGAWGDNVVTQGLKCYDRVMLHLHDGTTYVIPVDTLSTMKSYFADDKAEYVVDVDGSDALYQFLRKEIAVIRFLEAPDQSEGVEQVTVDDSRASLIHIENGCLHYGMSMAGQRVAFYDVSGRVVSTVLLDDSRVLSLGWLPLGVYVIRVNGYTLKFMKQ